MESRLPRDLFDVINILAVREPRSRYFLLLGQKKVPKEKAAPKGANGPLRFSGLGPSPSHSTSLCCSSGARIHARSPDGLHPKPCDARDRALRGPNNNYHLEPILPLAAITRKTPTAH